MKSPEEKANRNLLKTYNASLVMCFDKKGDMHISFGGSLNEETDDMTTLMFMLNALIAGTLDKEITAQDEFWEVLRNGVEKCREIYY